MKKIIKVIILSLIIIVVVGFVGLSAFIGINVVNSSTQLSTNETTGDRVTKLEWEKYKFDDTAFFEKYEVEEMDIPSTFEKHRIPISYIYADKTQKDKDNNTVIMAHGLGGNRKTLFPIVEMFLENGYNVLAFDQRSSGENTAKYTTFGYYEKFDVIDCLDYVKEKAPNKKAGLWGESFGGATVGLAMEYKDTDSKIDFAILDSPVSSMEWMLGDNMRDIGMRGIPLSYVIKCGNLINKIKLGFIYADVDVPKAIKDVNTPVLIINSMADKVTPYFMGKDIFDSIKGNNKELWTVEDSAHVEERIDYKDEYSEKIKDLILN